MEKLRSLLVNIPDLVKGLTRVQYGKASSDCLAYERLLTVVQAQPTEVATILVSLQRIGEEFKNVTDAPFGSALLNSVLKVLPSVRESSKAFLGDISTKAAKDNDEANLWADPDKYPEVQDAKDVSGPGDHQLIDSVSAYASRNWTNTWRRCESRSNGPDWSS
jgi:DNA mismatch repair protein MSH3